MIESEEDDTSFTGSLYYENSEKAEPEEMELEQEHKRPLYEDEEEEVRPKRLTVTEAGRFTVTAARKSPNTTFFPEGQEKRPKKTSNSSRENSNDSDHYEVIQVKAELHTDET